MNNDGVQGELRQGLGAAQSAFGQASGDAQTDLRGKAQEFVGKVQSAYEEAKDHAVETIDGVDAFVSERPYLTAAIMAAAGLFIGFVMGLGRPKVIVIRPAAPPR